MTTTIDYQHPLTIITPHTMATYRHHIRQGRHSFWRPVAAYIVAVTPKRVTVRIAGRARFRQVFREIHVNPKHLYPATEIVKSYLQEYEAATCQV